MVFFLHLHIVDFGVAHLFETLTASEQSSGHLSTPFSPLGNDLPVSNRPLHMLTRAPTGLMSNTAGTTYFYPPECCEDQPYNTYAADVSLLGVIHSRSGHLESLCLLWSLVVFLSTTPIRSTSWMTWWRRRSRFPLTCLLLYNILREGECDLIIWICCIASLRKILQSEYRLMKS